MSETERYKQTLELIEREGDIILGLMFGTPELELRIFQLTVAKFALFAKNALTLHAPRPVEDRAK